MLSGVDSCFAGGVDTEKLPAAGHSDSKPEYRPHRHHAGKSAEEYPVDTLVFPGAEILAGEGKRGLIAGVHRHIYESLNACRGGISGDDDLAEQVY